MANSAFEAGGGLLNIVEFTSDGNWTCPQGVTKAFVTVVAGGGGGGGGGTTGPVPGGGGGGGGVSLRRLLTVVPSTVYAITVGAGGTGGTGSTTGNDGTAGGNSQFGSEPAVTGGGAGQRGLDNLGAQGGGDIYSGGTGFTPLSTYSINGMAGAARPSTSFGGAGGGCPFFGIGGAGGFSTTPGANGTGYGAGGGGGGPIAASYQGGDGTGGLVRIEF